ncbi:MAG: iron-containing alcohol dehydrogenase [Clostridia bacterium]|nr:iron-containing alcohol dehydrogenase [Clostridia bacterium]MBR3195310.1 iron-containing alcohol dehydrogenase [Clostridia bacterium]
MYNFALQMPTKLYFGKGQVFEMGKDIAACAKKVLMVYGGGSIKRNGAYDDACKMLEENGIQWCELSGVRSNPRIESVYEGIRLCRENGLEAILAVGGGSSIDCSKAIAANVHYDGDAWDAIMKHAPQTDKVLPVFTVITLAATGSEMNRNAVISNLELNIKTAIMDDRLTPVATVMDPTYSYSVNAFYTAAGIADIMSHTFENYFSKETDAYAHDRLAEAGLLTCIQQGPVAVKEPENYAARAALMYISPWVINGLTRAGKSCGWSCHPIEHELSAYYDVCHGAGLAIVTPAWMRHILSDATVDKFAEYGVNVWRIDPSLDRYEIANRAIDCTEEFFRSIGLPMTLRELGITEKDKFEEMAQNIDNAFGNAYVVLHKEDVLQILEACF